MADLDIASNMDEDHRYNQGCSQNHRSVRTIRSDQLLLEAKANEGEERSSVGSPDVLVKSRVKPTLLAQQKIRVCIQMAIF